MIEAGLDAINISVDASGKEVFEATRMGLEVRQGDRQHRALVRLRAEMGRRRPKLILSFVRQDNSPTSRPSSSTGGASPTRSTSPICTTGPARCTRESDVNYPCYRPWLTFTVLWDGRVSLCCADFDGRHVLGDLNTSTIQEVWNGAPYVAARRQHLESGGPDICRSCDLPRKDSPLWVTKLTSPVVSAGELEVRIADGRATVIARDVTVAQILSEWARVGNTRVVNGEKLLGAPLTLELVDMPEKQVLDILLRSAAGYMTAPRADGVAGTSLYDRVVILATSQAPVNPPPVAQPFNRPFIQQAVPQPAFPQDVMMDDQGNPVFDPNVAQPGMVPPPGMLPPPGMVPATPYQVPAGPQRVPGVPQGPVTSPTPGQLPQQPQPTPLMPYTPPDQVPPPNPPTGGPFMTPVP
jgi:hypothetical protein